MDFIPKDVLINFLRRDFSNTPGYSIDSRLFVPKDINKLKLYDFTNIFLHYLENISFPFDEYPEEIQDYYLARNYQEKPLPKYTQTQVSYLTKNQLQELGSKLGLSIINKNRIFRILDIMGLIETELTILLRTPELLNNLCKYLNPNDINNMRIAARMKTIKYPLMIKDLDKGDILTLSEINTERLIIKKDIESDGLRYFISYHLNKNIIKLFGNITNGNITNENIKNEVIFKPLEIISHEGISLDIINTLDGRTPLLDKALKGSYDAVEFLIKHKANINFQDPYGDTALSLAAFKHHYKIVNYLLESGADPNQIGHEMSSALINAITNRLKMDEYAREIPNNPWEKGKYKINPIKLMVKNLLKYKANINYVNGVGYTPLLSAVTDNNPILIKLLLKHEADKSLGSQKLWEEYYEFAMPDVLELINN